MSSNRFSCSVECPKCLKRYKTSRATWGHMRKCHQLSSVPVSFLDKNDSPVAVPEAQAIPSDSVESARYHEWLVSVVERINEALHPALPGRWTKVEDPCVPETFVLGLIGRVAEETDDVISPHSIRYLPHRGLPYRSESQRISYRVYDLRALKAALEEQQQVELSRTKAFRHFEAVDTQAKLTMSERIAQMKSSAGVGYLNRAVHVPTSRSILVISEGEGRATREAEIIYWPNLYTVSKTCKFQLRFFISKCGL